MFQLPTDLPDVTGYHRPPMRGHPTREGTFKKDRKKDSSNSRKIENRKCPGKKLFVKFIKRQTSISNLIFKFALIISRA